MMHFTKPKQFFLHCTIIPALCLFLFMTGCATGPKTLVVSQTDLQTKVEHALKTPISVHPLLTLKVVHPLVVLDEPTNRVITSMHIELLSSLIQQPLTVMASISGTLKYNPSPSQIVLTQTQLESFDLPKIKHDSPLYRLLEQGIKTLAKDAIQELTLYQFKEKELTLGGTAYVPTRFKLNQKALEVTLEPAH